MNIVLRVPRTTPGLALNNDKTGLTFRKELIYENIENESFKKKTAPDQEQEFTVDVDKLNHWANTGNQMVQNGVKVPVPVKHTDDPESNRGNVIRFERGINKSGREALFGIIRFRDAKAAELAASTDVSIFVPDKPIYDGFGNEYIQPIRHVCCTDYPVIPKLGGFEAIAASLELTWNPIKDLKDNYQLAKNYHAEGLRQRAEREGINHAPVNPKKKFKLGATLQKGADILGNPVKHLKAKANDAIGKTRAAFHEELNHAARNVVHTTREEIRTAVRDEINQLKSRIKGAPKAAGKYAVRAIQNAPKRLFGTAIKHPVAAGVVATGALATHFGKNAIIDRLFKGKKKEVAASLELSSNPKVVRVVRKVYKTESAKRAAESRAHNAIMKKAKQPFIGKSDRVLTNKNGRKVLIGAGILSAAALGTAIYKHIQQHAELSASLELGDADQPRNQMGRYASNPNSKASQREARRQLRAREEPARGSIGASGLPSLKSAVDSAKTKLYDFYHADKNELAAPTNAAFATKHAIVGTLHAIPTILAGGLALRYGKKAYKAIKAGDLDRIQKYGAGTAAAASAVGGLTIGTYDHYDAARQHFAAIRSKRKK